MAKKLDQLAKQFPAVALLGPRQSGKTTLARELFPKYNYVNLEEPDLRLFAKEDPRGFLKTHVKDGIILDEVQHVPELLSYIQGMIDSHKIPGQFLLTGSQNILLNQQVSQTLAGRIAIMTLLPLTIGELEKASLLPSELDQVLFQGCYPRIYDQSLSPLDWYPNYIRTYVERDIRQIQQVHDLTLFQKFLKLCAGRIGQLLNLTSLANDCGISVNTAKSWISLLETTYLIFLLYPHSQNFSKRLVKMPKLYFFDSGIACSLLGINSPDVLASHYIRGNLFESFVLSDLMKQRFNQGLAPHYYFWRDKMGHEVDCICEKGEELIPIEIKSGATVNTSYFEGLNYWNKLSGRDPSHSYVIYGGDTSQFRSQGSVLSWREISSLPL